MQRRVWNLLFLTLYEYKKKKVPKTLVKISLFSPSRRRYSANTWIALFNRNPNALWGKRTTSHRDRKWSDSPAHRGRHTHRQWTVTRGRTHAKTTGKDGMTRGRHSTFRTRSGTGSCGVDTQMDSASGRGLVDRTPVPHTGPDCWTGSSVRGSAFSSLYFPWFFLKSDWSWPRCIVGNHERDARSWSWGSGLLWRHFHSNGLK